MRIILATRNKGKLDELRALLAELPVELVSAAEVDGAPEVIEDAPTLEGNATKKAVALWQHAGLPALADDTGLEVRALGGRPGVLSARYAGPQADAAANRRRLLADLEGVADRAASFRTVLAFATEDNVCLFEGICAGTITAGERGAEGFGYDSIFQPDGQVLTFAEMPIEQKNIMSHRRRALDAFAEYLRTMI
jgi:XTP/dITP diphosphohydrolase